LAARAAGIASISSVMRAVSWPVWVVRAAGLVQDEAGQLAVVRLEPAEGVNVCVTPTPRRECRQLVS
jgi:hypothetical protein